MKISYKTLNGFHLTKKGNLIKGNHVYIEKDACNKCGDPYLTAIEKPSKYCCLSCSQFGVKRSFTEEHRKKLSIARKGTHPSKETLQKQSKIRKGKFKGDKNPFYGKKHSIKTKNKISESQNKRIKNFKPEDHPNYIHGLSKTKAYRSQAQRERTARKRNSLLYLTQEEKNKIMSYYRLSDFLGKDWNVDHIVPLSKGGLHHPDNLQLLPAKINFKKYNSIQPNNLEYRGIRL
jgi:5-methylcytosine-specific restriction endonuclease McrA